MKEHQEKLARRGENYTMDQMAAISHPKWKELSLAEKQKYELQAKSFKLDYKLTGRLACDGTSVLENLEREARREERERQMRQGIVDLLGRPRMSEGDFKSTNALKKLYFIYFNILVKIKEQNKFIPIEVGLVEYTIKEGIRRDYHNFIITREIPIGYSREAIEHSETTHGISVIGLEDKEENYSEVWQDIIDFISPQSGSEDLPPLFCPKESIPQNLGSLEWLAEQAGQEDYLDDIKLWDSNFLHMELRAGAGSPAASYAIAEEEMKNSSFDYVSGLRCNFHEEGDNMYCALGKVKSLCYIISDVMCKLFKITATSKHLPERALAEKHYEVYKPTFKPASVGRESRGKPKPRLLSYDSRPGSAAYGEAYPQLPTKSNLDTRSSTTTPSVSVYGDSMSSYGSDNESEVGSSISSVENQNAQRTSPRTIGTPPGVQLRQPVATSYALKLARGRAAPAIVPGKGIGRGQRKE